MKKEATYFQAKRHFVILLSIVVFIGYIVDLIVLENKPYAFLANLLSIGIVILTVVLTYFFIINVKLSFAIVLYSLLLNIFVSFFINAEISGPVEAETLRSLLFICMLIPVAGFVIEKKHALIIGGILLSLYLIVIIVSPNKYLLENFYLISVSLIGYTMGMYYLLYLWEKFVIEQKVLIDELEERNNELGRANSLLSEQNSFIESQKEELNSTIESRDKLLTVISHDIKNPLFAIISFCDLIKDKISHAEFERVNLYSEMIQISANNLYRLVLNLLDWTRFQGGKLQSYKQVIDAEQNIIETIKLFDNSFKQKDIELNKTIQAGTKIFADINMFNTIIRNLISNAIKYCPSGGKININSKIENDNYYFIISDTGGGMRPEEIDSILNKTTNISTVGTEGESGTGLGLVLCKEFISLHNGELSINSAVGVGSEFIVCLPVQSSD
jgi:signal transduction histidine kinase